MSILPIGARVVASGKPGRVVGWSAERGCYVIEFVEQRTPSDWGATTPAWNYRAFSPCFVQPATGEEVDLP